MKFRLIFTLVFMFCLGTLSAQNVKALEKQHKALMKSLKKANKLKDVSIKYQADGFWYFELSDKYGNMGAADQNGKIIIPINYEMVTYVPALTETDIEVPCKDYKTKQPAGVFNFYRPASRAVFFAKGSETSLFSAIGEKIFSSPHTEIGVLPGYLILGDSKINVLPNSAVIKYNNKLMTYINVSSYSKMQLITLEGKEVVSNVKDIDFREKDRIVEFERRVDGVNKKGAKKLDNLNDSVPCMFYMVNRYEGKWYVQETSNSKSQVYDPNKSYLGGYRDKGEEYYEKREYDNVIDFYSKEGIDAPWAKFFSAKAFYMQALFDISTRDDMLISQFLTAKYDKETLESMVNTSKRLYQEYIKEDTIYKEEALLQIELCDKFLAELPDRWLNIEKKIEEYKRQQEAAAEAARLEQIRLAEERQRRQAQIMAQCVNIFAKALDNIITSAQRSNSRSYQSSSYRGGSSGSVSSRSNSGSSSSGGGSSYSSTPNKRQEKCRACSGTGFWVDERISGDEKWCDKCGKARKPHTHKKCGTCDGKGWHY